MDTLVTIGGVHYIASTCNKCKGKGRYSLNNKSVFSNLQVTCGICSGMGYILNPCKVGIRESI